MTLLAFDFGLARTGIAIGNTLTRVATPLCVLHSRDEKPDWQSITKVITEWQPKRLIVGMPTYLDGSKSEMTLKTERFCRQLAGRYTLPVETINEQLSSLEAEQRLKQSRQRGRKKKINKGEIDQLAAAIILESWMQQNG